LWKPEFCGMISARPSMPWVQILVPLASLRKTL